LENNGVAPDYSNWNAFEAGLPSGPLNVVPRYKWLKVFEPIIILGFLAFLLFDISQKTSDGYLAAPYQPLQLADAEWNFSKTQTDLSFEKQDDIPQNQSLAKNDDKNHLENEWAGEFTNTQENKSNLVTPATNVIADVVDRPDSDLKKTTRQITGIEKDYEEKALLQKTVEFDRETMSADFLKTSNLAFIDKENSDEKGINSEHVTTLPKIKKHRNHLIKGLYLGISASYNHTSMTDDQHIVKSDSLIFRMVGDQGFSYGVTAGYNFNDHFGIQAELISNSTQRQNYTALSAEGQTKGTLERKYIQVPITANFKITRLWSFTNQPISFNFYTGGYYAQLRSAERNDKIPEDQQKRGTIKGVEKSFVSEEYGGILGFDVDTYISKNFYLSLGLRGSLSTNINAQNIDRGDTWRNAVLGFRGGINYVFKTGR
jgi:hypothetical protein